MSFYMCCTKIRPKVEIEIVTYNKFVRELGIINYILFFFLLVTSRSFLHFFATVVDKIN